MSDSGLDFDTQKFFQDRQMRFDAALKVMVSNLEHDWKLMPAIINGIELADLLLEELDKTET